MNIVILYRKNSENYRPVQDFIRLMSTQYPNQKVSEIEIDTRDGANMATMYGVMSFPGIIAKSDSGSVLGIWQGLPLPRVDEIVGISLA